MWEFPRRGRDRSRQCSTKTEISSLSFRINSISFGFACRGQKYTPIKHILACLVYLRMPS